MQNFSCMSPTTIATSYRLQRFASASRLTTTVVMSNSCGHGSEQHDDTAVSRPAAAHTVAPLLLMLKGHPGCGKSTLAAALARRLAWPLIDKDDAKDCLSALPCDPAALNAVSYAIMFSVAATQLRCGNSVIVDCPLARVELWNQATQIADQVQHTEKLRRRRLMARNAMLHVHALPCTSHQFRHISSLQM